jgi:hypothetical protein
MMDLKSIKPIHKVCPKCKNRLFIEADVYGLREYCACGFSHDLPDTNPPTFKIPAKNLKE